VALQAAKGQVSENSKQVVERSASPTDRLANSLEPEHSVADNAHRVVLLENSGDSADRKRCRIQNFS
jgi:hypothetical protein